ncbi:Calcium/proton exchanger [Mycena venus]|uniref:Calcium/proton exchanger n=1 Tax=Mycena venus TaxID=2733690 RepID=A0A8H7CJT2_9AGAR|nr:Calcium/proton exchanger [Mycena venus]
MPTQRPTLISRVSRVFRVFIKSFKPHQPVGKAPGILKGLYILVLASRWNYFLICVPVTFLVRFGQGAASSTVFLMAFLALLPTAKIFKLAMEDLTLRVSPHAGTVIRVLAGNTIEFISGIIAIRRCELEVLQASVIGSILSNILLVLGVACQISVTTKFDHRILKAIQGLSGGIKFAKLGFSPNHAHTTSHLLMLGVLATLLPSIFASSFGGSSHDMEQTKISILQVSRAVSVCLLSCYLVFSVYQLYSHASTFEDRMQSTRYRGSAGGDTHSTGRTARSLESGEVAVGDAAGQESNPSMSLSLLLVTGIVTCVLITTLTEFLVESLSVLTEKLPFITEQWVGLVLIPLAGTFSRYDVLEAVSYSRKDEMDSSLGLSLGSSVNISLFIQPLLVLLAWMMHKNLTLLYDPPFFLSVLFVNFTLLHGQSDWLSGLSLLVLYLLIAISFWFYTNNHVFNNLVPACQGL